MLFNYKDVEDNFENILKEWFRQKDILNPAAGLLLDTFYNPGTFNEQKFLNIVHAVETYHRRYRNNEVRTPEDHKKMIEAILSSTPTQHKEWLQQKLLFSNEPTLQQRLEDLLAQYWNPTLEKIVTSKDTLIKQAKNSRNYYTHYDKSLENVALHGSDLYYLTERLKVLLICCVLSATSFSKPEIERLLNRNEWQFFSHILQSRPTSGPS
jgi:hypothetical protein